MCSFQKVLICDVACFPDEIITLAVNSIDISNLQNYIIKKNHSRATTMYLYTISEILGALHDVLEQHQKLYLL